MARSVIVAAAITFGLSSSVLSWLHAEPPTSSRPSPAAGLSGEDLVNHHIRLAWEDAGIRPAKKATSHEWVRRVYLDLIGRIPTIDELRRFQRSRGADGKAKLLDRLLGAKYQQEYARHWSTVWTNILIGRTGGQERRSLTNRQGMQEYLREAFEYNKPYDQLVHELITARGSTAPGADDFNGAANFLAGKLDEDGVQATAKTAQIFLGVQVQCTQCHNHPFNEHQQNQFWELNAFFRQTVALRSFEGRQIAGVRLDDQDFPGESGDPHEADVFYVLRNGNSEVAFPVFIDGTALADLYKEKNEADFLQQAGRRFGLSGYVEEINRRQELAKLVVASPSLEQAIVNRMWAHFLGVGFTKPHDDMGPHNAPSHPELLAQLSQRFRAAQFDLKQLIRWIVLSEPYELSSRMTKEHEQLDNPPNGTRPAFSHFYIRQMQAEQLYESLLVATQADATLGEESAAAKSRWLRQFSAAFGTDEGDESTTFNGSIPQSLMMMNGELVKKASGTDPGTFLYQVATDPKLSNKQRIDHLYLAALSRRPTGEELTAANYLVRARKGDTAKALQDVWWALLNSNEFILNH